MQKNTAYYIEGQNAKNFSPQEVIMKTQNTLAHLFILPKENSNIQKEKTKMKNVIIAATNVTRAFLEH